jgi:hypothetical protein
MLLVDTGVEIIGAVAETGAGVEDTGAAAASEVVGDNIRCNT